MRAQADLQVRLVAGRAGPQRLQARPQVHHLQRRDAVLRRRRRRVRTLEADARGQGDLAAGRLWARTCA